MMMENQHNHPDSLDFNSPPPRRLNDSEVFDFENEKIRQPDLSFSDPGVTPNERKRDRCDFENQDKPKFQIGIGSGTSTHKNVTVRRTRDRCIDEDSDDFENIEHVNINDDIIFPSSSQEPLPNYQQQNNQENSENKKYEKCQNNKRRLKKRKEYVHVPPVARKIYFVRDEDPLPSFEKHLVKFKCRTCDNPWYNTFAWVVRKKDRKRGIYPDPINENEGHSGGNNICDGCIIDFNKKNEPKPDEDNILRRRNTKLRERLSENESSVKNLQGQLKICRIENHELKKKNKNQNQQLLKSQKNEENLKKVIEDLEHALDSYFERVTYVKRKKIIDWLVEEIFEVVPKHLKSYHRKSGGKTKISLKTFKYGFKALGKYDLDKDWEKNRNIISELLDAIERKKLSLRVGYCHSDNAKKKLKILKQTIFMGFEKLINLRRINPFGIIISLLLKIRTGSFQVLNILEKTGLCCSPNTLKNFVEIDVVRIRRRNGDTFRKYRISTSYIPNTLKFHYHQMDNGQVIQGKSRKTLARVSKPIIYTMNVRVKTPFLCDKIDLCFVNMKKVKEIDWVSVYFSHEKIDLKKRSDLLEEIFVDIRATVDFVDRIFKPECERKGASDVIELLENQYEKTVVKTCDGCYEDYTGSNNTVCSKCGGCVNSLSRERLEWKFLKEEFKHKLEDNVTDDLMGFFHVKMEGMESRGVKEQEKMEVFKGIVGDPGEIEKLELWLRSLVKERNRLKQDKMLFGADGSPHMMFLNLKTKYPDLYKWIMAHNCLFHTKREFQLVIVRVCRKVAPEILDILDWTSERSKDFVENNGDNHKTRDFVFILFKALYIELLKFIEKEYGGVRVDDPAIFTNYMKRLRSEKEASFAVVLFDLCSNYVMIHISSRRGDVEGVYSGVRLGTPYLFVDKFFTYQKLMVKDLVNTERMRGENCKELYDLYAAMLLHPTKRGLDGHVYQEAGASLEEINMWIKWVLGVNATEENWDLTAETFEDRWEAIRNGRSIFAIDKDGYETLVSYILDIIAACAAIRFSDCFSVTHFSTLDGKDVVDKNCSELLSLLLHRMKNMFLKYKKSVETKTQMRCQRKQCEKISFDGEREYANEEFTYDGPETEKELSVPVPNTKLDPKKYHNNSGCEDFFTVPQSHKFESKLIEGGGKIKCCRKGCEKWLVGVFGNHRCERCGGYYSEGTKNGKQPLENACGEVLRHSIGDDMKIVHASLCRTCLFKVYCCGNKCKKRKRFRKLGELDKCSKCKRFAHPECLNEVGSGPDLKWICGGCERKAKTTKKKMNDEE